MSFIFSPPTRGQFVLPESEPNSRGVFQNDDNILTAVWFIASATATGFILSLPFISGRLVKLSAFGYAADPCAAHTVTLTDQHGRSWVVSVPTGGDDNCLLAEISDLAGSLIFTTNAVSSVVRYAMFFDNSPTKIIPVTPVGATHQATPGDPTGTTSATGVHMGLASAVTPVKSGTILAIISGDLKAGGAGTNQIQIRYGTGSAPANGAALTGTAVGNLAKAITSAVAQQMPATCNAVVAGLVVGTQYWLDVSLATSTGTSATIKNVSVSVVEQ